MEISNDGIKLVIEEVTLKRYYLVYQPQRTIANQIQELGLDIEPIPSIDEIDIENAKYTIEDLPDNWESDPVFSRRVKWLNDYASGETVDRSEPTQPKKTRKKRVDNKVEPGKIEEDDFNSLLDNIL